MLYTFDLGEDSFLINSNNKTEIKNKITHLKSILLSLEGEQHELESSSAENSFKAEMLALQIENFKGVIDDLSELLSEEPTL